MCDEIPAWVPHYPARDPCWADETATPEEQSALKRAHGNGATIEAKGRDTVDVGYKWAVTPNPRWDFRNNHYRIATDEIVRRKPTCDGLSNQNMITIQNVSKRPRKTGLHTYEVCVVEVDKEGNKARRVLCRYRHRREDGMPVCLEKAARAVALADGEMLMKLFSGKA